jgi:hypothetical protein
VYFDTKPCQVCGSSVDLRPREPGDQARVTEADGTPDERICTNPDSPTREGGEDAPLP